MLQMTVIFYRTGIWYDMLDMGDARLGGEGRGLESFREPLALHRVVKEATFERKNGMDKRANRGNIWRKSIPGTGTARVQ